MHGTNGNGTPPHAGDVRVVIIGAGVSGICLGVHLKRAGLHDVTILEKSDGVGGTWRENSYPGAGCDVPSTLYSFSFEPKPDWSRIFSPQAEILAYLEHVTDKYGLRPHIRFGTAVTDARWDDARGLWTVRTDDGATRTAHVLVSGVGQLNRPFTPAIPGLADFAGTTFHSARWNHAHDLAGKTVAVIGNGASAIQFIPQIQPRVARLHVFQRSANWMIPRNDRHYTEGEKRFFTRHPLAARAQRALTWALLETRWPAFSKGSRWGRWLERKALDYMHGIVADPVLRRKLTPDYPVGCKRILISDDYYQAIVRANVEVVTDHVTGVTRDAIVTADGTSRPVDTIIFATGFQSTDFLAPMAIHGAEGRALHDVWRDGAEAYLGVSLAGFPNLFLLYGPNTNLGHNSIILMIERQVGFVMQCVQRLRARRLKAIAVREDAMRRFNAELQASLRRSVWDAGCHSWYKTDGGRIVNNWAHGTISYWWRTRHPDWRDFAETPAGA